MGLFRKKSDPISERSKQLNQQIEALEAEIHRLSARSDKEANGSEAPKSRPASQPQPRLRSTALPHGQSLSPPPPPSSSLCPAPQQEPIFEEVDQERLQMQPELGLGSHENDLGVRKDDVASTWRRWKNHFRGPVASNPKLVHYLSAGSIQGLRPLRYEKRVARNRFIVLAVFLVLALWGTIAILISRN